MTEKVLCDDDRLMRVTLLRPLYAWIVHAAAFSLFTAPHTPTPRFRHRHVRMHSPPASTAAITPTLPISDTSPPKGIQQPGAFQPVFPIRFSTSFSFPNSSPTPLQTISGFPRGRRRRKGRSRRLRKKTEPVNLTVEQLVEQNNEDANTSDFCDELHGDDSSDDGSRGSTAGCGDKHP